MARLQWENVEAPDFRGTLDGYKVASEMFGNAIEAAREGVDDFQKNRTEAADNAVLNGLLKYQGRDPAELEKALQDGSFVGQFDPKVMQRMSAATRQTLLTQPGKLLEHAVKTAEFGQQKLAIADQGRVRALEPLYNQYLQINQNDPTGAAGREFMTQHPELQNMSTRDFDTLMDKGLGTAKDTFGHSENVTEFQQAQDAHQLGIQVEGLQAKLNKERAPQDQLRYLNQNRDTLVKDYGARAVDRLINQFSGADAAGAGPSGGSGGGGSLGGSGGGVSGNGTGIGGKNLYDVVLGDTPSGGNTYGFQPPKPVSQMSMGELFDYQRTVMVPKTAAAGVGNGQGSSAAGAFQIVSKTLERAAPKVFGADWRNVQFTAENQDKLGEFLFNEADKTQLHKVWEGLPAGDYRGKSWAEMRSLITQNESGGVDNPREAKAFADTAIQHQYGTDPLTPLEQGFKENFGNTSSAKQMAIGMVAKGQDFEGEDPDYLAAVINETASKYKLSPALAAVAVRQSTDGKDGFFRRPFSDTFGDGLKVYIDDTRLEANAKALQDREGMARKVAKTTTQSDRMAGSGQAQAQLASAKAALQAKIDGAARRGNTNPDLSLELQAVARAEALVASSLTAEVKTMVAGEEPGPAKPAAKKKSPNPKAPLILANAASTSSSPAPRPSGRGPLLTGGGGVGADQARVLMAMNSGLPQFAKKSGETNGAWQARIAKIVLGR